MPVCSKCGQQKEFNEFPVDRSKASGRSPRCTMCSRKSSAAYDASHKKKRHKYNKRNAAHIAAVSLQWRLDHPEQNRVLHEQYRASVVGAEGTVTLEDWQEILADNDFKCAYCGADVDGLTMDHVIPLSRGGKHTPDNIVPACATCNNSKGTKDVESWLQQRNGG